MVLLGLIFSPGLFLRVLSGSLWFFVFLDGSFGCLVVLAVSW